MRADEILSDLALAMPADLMGKQRLSPRRVGLECDVFSVDASSALTQHLAMSAQAKRLVTLGQQLRRARQAKELSQEALAALAQLDRTYVSLVERGKCNLSFLNLCKFADALGVTPSELIRGI